MRYFALAADYDGTVATSGTMSEEVEAALERLRSSGRRALLVTGRTFEELASHRPNFELFDCVVLENGGTLYSPSKRQTIALSPPPALELVRELERRGVEPVLTGQAILTTRRPHELLVLGAIRDLGLDLQITFNGEAVMVLPSGVDKGSGLRAALDELELSVHEVVGVGNAENDHPFLDICACAVAVDNAEAAIKARSDFCTRGPMDMASRSSSKSSSVRTCRDVLRESGESVFSSPIAARVNGVRCGRAARV